VSTARNATASAHVFDVTGPYRVAADDVVFARIEGVELLARIYRPVGEGAPLRDRPLIIDVHGGAWRYFDRTVDAYYDERLASCGAVVVAVDFRQAPEHQWPSAAADVHAAVRWAKAHGRALGVRTDRVGILGGSSGGHLALVTALRPNDPMLQTTPWLTDAIDLVDGFPADTAASSDAASAIDETDGRCTYVLALWPIAAPDWRYRYLLDRLANPTEGPDARFDPERLKRQHDRFFGNEATMFEANVIRMVDERSFDQLPPIWIAHPELDENVTLEMSEALADAFRDAGGSAELEIFHGEGHSFANFGGEAADRCITSMRAFIQRQLHDHENHEPS